jgi:hypothetical protein
MAGSFSFLGVDGFRLLDRLHRVRAHDEAPRSTTLSLRTKNVKKECRNSPKNKRTLKQRVSELCVFLGEI